MRFARFNRQRHPHRVTPTSTDPCELLAELEELRDVAAGLAAGRGARVGNLWGASQPLFLRTLELNAPGPWLALVATELEAEALAEDLGAYGAESFRLPARESGSVDAVRERLRLAQALAGPPERRPRLIVASQLSLLQPLPSPRELEGQFLHVQRGQKIEAEELLGRLVAAGYTRQPLAEQPGEVSLRGDILDVYAFAADRPLRIEVFDDEVESLRSFDPADQRSLEILDRAALCLAADAGGVEDGQGAAPLTLLSPTTVVVEVEPLRIEDQRQGLRVRSTSHSRALDEFLKILARHPLLQLQSLPTGDYDLDGKSVQQLGQGLAAAPGALVDLAKRSRLVQVRCRTEAEAERFATLLEEKQSRPDNVELVIGTVSKGFRLESAGLTVINHHELAGVAAQRGPAKERPQHKARALRSFFELKIGDLVVHAIHGLSRYAGLERMRRGGGEEDHLHLVFADEVSLFVPSSRVDLVQRYIGTGGAAPKLDKLGGATFKRRKEKVEKALQDLAADLLEVQAKREMQRRPIWEGDRTLVNDMLRAFPYEDTPDQASADAEIGGDLSGEKPMDRLLCGDVGFGKTEVAMRAAFRVVAAGGQVAVLVPTTVLADQHARSFRARMAGFPVRIEELTRLNSNKATKELVADVGAGKVDILIGTHRILSKDVHFQRLGLVVIDEEQRFGVKHKEHFKGLRAQVDVLTLSATPIPRTLHMSLSGVRDISALTVPPAGRLDCITKLGYTDDVTLIREVLLREKERGGQSFYLHNRVDDMQLFQASLEAIVPEVKVIHGHGQMSAKELAKVMAQFSAGEADVLLATTIIENGIDIPTAGTILIDQADRFGLSELHQLRGRVGRAAQQAYCYLLVDRTRPLRQASKERLKALEEMSHLGAGFQISMKDLELRGAGNLLGPEQSGHIAAVGYDMYCRLLGDTVERLKQGGLPTAGPGSLDLGVNDTVELELGLRAFLPQGWVASADERLELLRQLDGISAPFEADEVLADLRDRFGRVPREALDLVRAFRVRAALAPYGLRRLAWRDGEYLIEFSDRVALETFLAPGLDERGRDLPDLELRPLREGVALLVLPADVREAETGLRLIERRLGLSVGLEAPATAAVGGAGAGYGAARARATGARDGGPAEGESRSADEPHRKRGGRARSKRRLPQGRSGRKMPEA